MWNEQNRSKHTYSAASWLYKVGRFVQPVEAKWQTHPGPLEIYLKG